MSALEDRARPRFRTDAVTWNTYDAAGRRRVQFFPSIVYTGHGTVPGDSIRYTYDNLGNTLTAVSFNRGSITRTYYANGLLKSKTSVDAAGFTDVISYQYDQAWAVQRVVHNSDTTFYAYHATTGDLQTVTVRLGIGGPVAARERIFSFLWDGMGRLKQITYPATSSGSMTVNYRYDAAGILRRVKAGNPVPGNDIFDLTLRNKSVDAVGRILNQELLCPVGTVTGNPCGAVNSQPNQVVTTNAYNRMGWLVEQNRNNWIDRMRYDTSGNIIRKEDGQSGQVHHYTIDPGNPRHNRVKRDSVQGLVTLVMAYDANGSRRDEVGGVGDSREKHYYYDALARISGTFAYDGIDARDRPNDCRHDVDGQLAKACDGAPWLAFDGDNVSGTLFAEGEGWSFFHGLGLDSPLMGYYRPTGTESSRILYWVTDGAGRELAVADSAGKRTSSDQGEDQGTWRHAGGTANSYGFSADRQDNAVATNLSFFRNRVYDQNTGRWLQEDPLGVAGGLNLYQFNQNNPVMYTDPFGLCVPACAVPFVVGGVAIASSPAGHRLAQTAAVGLGLAAVAVVATSDHVAEVGAQVVESVGSTLRKIGNAIATAVGIGTGDQVPQIQQEPPPPTGKSAPPPPGTGKSPIEIGKDGIPRMKIPVDP